MIKLSYTKKNIIKTAVIITLAIQMALLQGCTKNADEVTWELEEEIASEQDLQDTEETGDVRETGSQEIGETVCVYVCGAVNSSGVYELPAGSRLYEAIALAGGMTDEADESYLNLAQVITDGEQITVPTVEEAQQLQVAEAAVDDGLVNINTASVSELTTLNGIGQTRAEAIIQYREQHGAFAVIEDIKNVSGIKDALFDKIKDYITTG